MYNQTLKKHIKRLRYDQVPLKKCLDKIKTCSRMSCPGKVCKQKIIFWPWLFLRYIPLLKLLEIFTSLEGSPSVWEWWCHLQEPVRIARGAISFLFFPDEALVLVVSPKKFWPPPSAGNLQGRGPAGALWQVHRPLGQTKLPNQLPWGGQGCSHSFSFVQTPS